MCAKLSKVHFGRVISSQEFRYKDIEGSDIYDLKNLALRKLGLIK